MHLLAVLLAAAVLSCLLALLLRPVLQRYALARPNARSSHRIPTPQGGGVPLLIGFFAALALAVSQRWLPPETWRAVAALGIAAALIGALGALDDIRPLPVWPRLAGQALAIGLALWGAGDEARILPALPLALERALEIFAGLWFVNLTNFMDGLDWLTLAGVAPLLAALAAFSGAGALPVDGYASAAIGCVAAALLGGLLGFAPWNSPPARLFLGDVGALAIGLIVAWLLFLLASAGHFVAAILLPLYYCADASITLCRRLLRRERIWEAHRQHFYQQAADRGAPVRVVTGQIALANAALCGLSALALLSGGLLSHLALLLAGAAIVGALLARLAGRW